MRTYLHCSPWAAYRRRLVQLLILLCLWIPAPLAAQLPEPTMLAEWQGNTLVVIASPGSLYLVGGDREDQYIGMEAVTLKASGVDAQYTPIGRKAIELRNNNGQVTQTLAIPEKPPDVFEQRLVLVVKPSP
jgi:hypothetical protein